MTIPHVLFLFGLISSPHRHEGGEVTASQTAAEADLLQMMAIRVSESCLNLGTGICGRKEDSMDSVIFEGDR